MQTTINLVKQLCFEIQVNTPENLSWLIGIKLPEDNFSSLPFLSVELKLLLELKRILNVFRKKEFFIMLIFVCFLFF